MGFVGSFLPETQLFFTTHSTVVTQYVDIPPFSAAAQGI